MKIKYRTENRTTETIQKDGVTFLRYRIFDGKKILNAVSTRLGGVSTGYLGTMNMSSTRGDDPENVEKNHALFGQAVGYDPDKLVMSDQVHDTRILRVNSNDAGGGVLQRGIDGLMTDVTGIPLMTFYADCVPLMFYDEKNHVIAISHSGWKGSVAKIGRITLERMKEEYGTKPEDVFAAIGPSVCQDCYEVDETLLTAFHKAFGEKADEWFLPSVNPGHYLLDLANTCNYTLESAGMKKDHIAMPDLCTCCNPDFLFSHRATGGKRGNLSVVMQLL